MKTIKVQANPRSAERDTAAAAIVSAKRFPKEINFVGNVEHGFSQTTTASLFTDERLAIALAHGAWIVMTATQQGEHPTTKLHRGAIPLVEDTGLPASIEGKAHAEWMLWIYLADWAGEIGNSRLGCNA